MVPFLLPLIILDLAFLPMLHLYGIPLKPSYIVIALLFVVTILYHPQSIRGLNREILLGFFLLIGLTIAGVLVVVLFYGASEYSLSLRNIIIYALAPMAFVVGTRDTTRRHNYIIVFILAYAGLSLVFSIYYQQLGWLVAFYGLQDLVGSGVYAIRSQGLFGNANISALFMTMLYLFFIAGVRHGFVKAGIPTLIVVVASVFGTIVILGSRNQFIAVSLLTALLALPMLASRRRRIAAISVAVVVVSLIVFSAQLGRVAGSYVGYDPSAALRHTFGSISDSSDRTNSFLRPVRGLEPALVRWSASPLVGTGFDSADVEHFGSTAYHNDWLVVLVSSGLLGFFILAFIAYRLTRLDLILLIPFLLPGLTNSFLFAPSHLLLYLLLAGMVWQRRRLPYQSELETNIAARGILPVG